MLNKFFKKTAFATCLLGLFLSPAHAELQKVKIGATPGTHAQTLEFVKDKLVDKGIDLEVIVFNDYVLPNQALHDGDLDINAFQHQPYLDQQIKDRNYEIISAGVNFVEPMGVYSQKITDLSNLETGATIAIPNDPTNGGRALLLLQENNLISLKKDVGLLPTIFDIADNPKELQFKELDAAQLPHILPDVTLAAINTNYAVSAGLIPTKDALLIEGTNSPYANIFAIRPENKDAKWVQTLIETYQSDDVKDFIITTFKGAVVPLF